MSEIQKGAASHPERCVIAHPFNPPHLIPLTAEEFYTSIGQRTVRVNKEMPGHVANRLQAALSREVYYLVAEGVVSAADVDTVLSWGPGLRWGVMGSLMHNHLGGGRMPWMSDPGRMAAASGTASLMRLSAARRARSEPSAPIII